MVEDYYYEALAITTIRSKLVFDEEKMKPAMTTEEPRNAGIDPATMKMKRWYQDNQDDIRVSDKSQGHTRKKKRDASVTGVERSSYQTRLSIEDDEGRLSQREGRMPPPPPERVDNPRIREDRAVQEWKTDEMHKLTYDDDFARSWFNYCRNVFPQSVRKVGPDVHLHSTSSYQCSILFNNMGSFNRKSEFRKSENVGKPLTKKEKSHYTDDPRLSLLREFWGNNYAHVILTAEADDLPKNEEELLQQYGLVGCHSRRSTDLSVHARIDSTGYVRLLWESDAGDDVNGHAAIFEVKFGKEKSHDSRERSAKHLVDTLEQVAQSVEKNIVNREDVEPTSECINDTKKRALVTRSGLTRLRCCVCHLHHERARTAPQSVRLFFKTV